MLQVAFFLLAPKVRTTPKKRKKWVKKEKWVGTPEGIPPEQEMFIRTICSSNDCVGDACLKVR